MFLEHNKQSQVVKYNHEEANMRLKYKQLQYKENDVL